LKPLSNLSPGGEASKITMNEELIKTTTVLKVPLRGIRGLYL
jgi:hypothetical protein